MQMFEDDGAVMVFWQALSPNPTEGIFVSKDDILLQHHNVESQFKATLTKNFYTVFKQNG